jgi:transposase-like protein
MSILGVQDNGDYCPYCGSDNLDQGSNYCRDDKKYKCCGCGKFFNFRVSICDVGDISNEED